MAKFFTHYAANKTLDAWCNSVTFTPPSQLFLILFTTSPTQVGTDGVEATGYTRPALSFATAATSVAAGEADVNLTGVAVQDLSGLGYADAASGGNVIWVNDSAPLSVTGDGNLTLRAADYAMQSVPVA